MANETAGGIGQAIQGLGAGERLAVLGAAGVLVAWLVFDLILQDYSIGHLPFVASALIVFFAYRLHVQNAVDWPVAYTPLIVVLAGVVGFVGVTELVQDIRYEIFDARAGVIIGAILFWVGAIAAGVGAVQMGNSNR